MTIKIAPNLSAKLKGKRVSLIKTGPEHAEFLEKTYQQDSFMELYRLAQDNSESIETIRARLKKEQMYPPHKLRKIEWVICLSENDNEGPIGLAALADYQPVHNRAELLIGITHNKKGIGSLGAEATLLVLEFAFKTAKLNKVTSFVYGYNEASQKNTLHLGFTQEALLRAHYYNQKNDQYIDLYQNGLLKSDFFQSNNLARWSKRLLNRDITTYDNPRKLQADVRALSNKEAKEVLERLRRIS